MIVKILISSLLTVGLLYVFLQSYRSVMLRALMLAVFVPGQLFTFNPELANHLAAFVGVGRGADLIFYIWVCIGFLLFANLFINTRRINNDLIQLSRKLALLQMRVDLQEGTSVRSPQKLDRPPKP